jgi:FtsP/CotA-like multicopper oxidase with cupredoxin domain
MAMISRRIRIGLAIGAIVMAPIVVTSQPSASAGSSNELLDPAPFVWTYVGSPTPHYVGTLEYGAATFDIGGYSLTTRAYRQAGGSYSIPGPTMHMVPGNTYVLRFRNLLPYEAPSHIHNDMKDPNITNLHTHGLHISGLSPGDDPLRVFEGGFGGDYVYEIPADHMGGTHWYHPHHHGSTFLQVATGGFGMIVVDDSRDGIPANVAAMPERHLVLGYLNRGAAGSGGDTLVSGTLPAGWTVNGMIGGELRIPSNTWQHWRILLADADARTKDVTVGPGCEAVLLARDGVWRTSAPKQLTANTINLTGASRADLAVRCSVDTDLLVNKKAVARIGVAGTANTSAHPFAADGTSMWSATRPAYLRDLRAESGVQARKISMGARTINGSKFDPGTPSFTLDANGVQEWSIQGAVNHPFHLHVHHLQAMAGCGGDFEPGEYYDTIAANCAVRFDVNTATGTAHAGRIVMHCHILDHEDQGAMVWMDVKGGRLAPILPAGLGYSAYYPLSGGPQPTPTPSTPPQVTSVTVGSVSVTTVNAGQGMKRGQASVVVVDNLGAPVQGATVTGDFTGTITQLGVTGPLTDASGRTTITTSGTAKGSVSLTFCVTSISHPNLADWNGSVCASN